MDDNDGDGFTAIVEGNIGVYLPRYVVAECLSQSWREHHGCFEQALAASPRVIPEFDFTCISRQSSQRDRRIHFGFPALYPRAPDLLTRGYTLPQVSTKAPRHWTGPSASSMATHELIDAQFDRAVQIVQSLPKTGPIQTDYEEKLEMYRHVRSVL